MADTKVSDLPTNAAPSSDDLLHIVNDPSGTPANQKVALSSLFADIAVTSDETTEGITPADLRYQEGDVRRYGATEGTSADSASAITTTFNYCRDYGLPMYMEGTYRIDSALTWTSTGAPTGVVVVFFKDAIITKNFNGAGLTCAGGAIHQAHYGNLWITKMLNAADGLGGGTPTAGDFGFVQNCKIIRIGALWVEKQQDDGYTIQADANMNGSIQGFVHSSVNNGKGFGGTLTTDNIAVWTGQWEAALNYEAGIEFADTFPARSWHMDWRAEDNAQDGTSDQVYFGGMSESVITVYSEEVTASTGVELNVPAAASNTRIYAVRINTLTQASSTCVIYRGNSLWIEATVGSEELVRGANIGNNAAHTMTKRWDGSGGTELVSRVIAGTGTCDYKHTGRTSSDVLSWKFTPDSGTAEIKKNDSAVSWLSDTGSIFLKEKAAADTNSAGFGQFWSENTVPSQPKFTGDTDVDLDIAVSDGGTGGTASAGAGNQYIEIEIGGTTYKVLHDGTV